MKMMATGKDSVMKSLPRGKVVRGYRVERMPIGRYLQAVRLLQEAPEEWSREILPDKGDMTVLSALKEMDVSGLQKAILSAAAVLPEKAICLFAEVSGIAEEKLLNDPNIGLDGLMELFKAFWEVNGLENFLLGAAGIGRKIRQWTRTAGSKG
jgi:hypothetical protein